jgi:4'-phosphopantetheinyl transferase
LDDTVEVIATRLDVRSEAVRARGAVLSDEERRRARRFAYDRDRQRFIIARGVLRELLAARLGVRPEAVELEYGVYGKPVLAPRFAASGLRFNVSHCDDVAVYAFSSAGDIGVDVEAVRPMPDADALDPRERALGFFQCWTRKEAFIKALGHGMYHPLDRFDVSLAPGEPAELLRVERSPGDRRRWRVMGFFPAPGFVAAAVAEQSGNLFVGDTR